MRRGWFIIPGVQHGDRTLQDQRLGLDKALAGCAGRDVLDLGCAEGLIALEFARAGAKSVLAIDSLAEHLEVAREVCRDYPCIAFEQADLNTPPPLPRRYDIVLALSVAHKMLEPKDFLLYAARASEALIVVRVPWHMEQGQLRSKYSGKVCDVSRVLRAEGFRPEFIEAGPRQEKVYYYYQKPADGLG